jgi:hypothetical protein
MPKYTKNIKPYATRITKVKEILFYFLISNHKGGNGFSLLFWFFQAMMSVKKDIDDYWELQQEH